MTADGPAPWLPSEIYGDLSAEQRRRLRTELREGMRRVEELSQRIRSENRVLRVLRSSPGRDVEARRQARTVLDMIGELIAATVDLTMELGVDPDRIARCVAPVADRVRRAQIALASD